MLDLSIPAPTTMGCQRLTLTLTKGSLLAILYSLRNIENRIFSFKSSFLLVQCERKKGERGKDVSLPDIILNSRTPKLKRQIAPGIKSMASRSHGMKIQYVGHHCMARRTLGGSGTVSQLTMITAPMSSGAKFCETE